MTLEQRNNLILAVMLLVGGIMIWSVIVFIGSPIKHPIESTITSILTCTVKSNIDGVITLNDDCKITEVRL